MRGTIRDDQLQFLLPGKEIKVLPKTISRACEWFLGKMNAKGPEEAVVRKNPGGSMLSARELRFLNESNRMEGLGDIVYRSDSVDGEARLFPLWKQDASDQRPLTVDTLCDA